MRGWFLLPALLLAACASEGARRDATEELLAADRAFAARSLEVGAPEAFYQTLTEDALQLPTAGEPVQGRNDIRESMGEGPKLVLAWQPQFAEVSASGDLGWTWGTWQASEPGAGGKRVARGKYVNVWRRQPDGTWKVRLDMGNVERKPAD